MTDSEAALQAELKRYEDKPLQVGTLYPATIESILAGIDAGRNTAYFEAIRLGFFLGRELSREELESQQATMDVMYANSLEAEAGLQKELQAARERVDQLQTERNHWSDGRKEGRKEAMNLLLNVAPEKLEREYFRSGEMGLGDDADVVWDIAGLRTLLNVDTRPSLAEQWEAKYWHVQSEIMELKHNTRKVPPIKWTTYGPEAYVQARAATPFGVFTIVQENDEGDVFCNFLVDDGRTYSRTARDIGVASELAQTYLQERVDALYASDS